jgi:hypothetical protein
MTVEETLSGWTGPSSPTEQDKQERTERMIREAVKQHPAFANCGLNVYAKGSYANNTNVHADSDVDIAVQCLDVLYWDQSAPGVYTPSGPYTGIWTPAKLRLELGAALKAKFPSQVDDSGTIAFQIKSSSARIDADVIPCFDYRYYFASGTNREGSKVFPKTGLSFENYPAQQLKSGTDKNTRTNTLYKKAVRVIKRIENAMLTNGKHREVPSYFMECLVYNCPDSVLMRSTWTERVKGILFHIWDGLQGDEPDSNADRWVEVNECKYLFSSSQKWARTDGRDFAKAAWNYLGLAS